MEESLLWKVFVETGAPEAYLLYVKASRRPIVGITGTFNIS